MDSKAMCNGERNGRRKRERVLLVLGRGMLSFVSSKTLDSYSNFITLLIPVLVGLEYPRVICAVCSLRIPASAFVFTVGHVSWGWSCYDILAVFSMYSFKACFILVFCL